MSGIKKIASLMTIISLTIFTISCNSTTNNQESVVQNNTNVLISSIDNNLAEEAIENVGNGTNNAETNENVNVTLDYENPSFIKENENIEDKDTNNDYKHMILLKVLKDDKFGLLDIDFNTILQPKYKNIRPDYDESGIVLVDDNTGCKDCLKIIN